MCAVGVACAHPGHAQHAHAGGALVVLALAAHYARVGVDRGRGAVASARYEGDGRAGQRLPVTIGCRASSSPSVVSAAEAMEYAEVKRGSVASGGMHAAPSTHAC